MASPDQRNQIMEGELEGGEEEERKRRGRGGREEGEGKGSGREEINDMV